GPRILVVDFLTDTETRGLLGKSAAQRLRLGAFGNHMVRHRRPHAQRRSAAVNLHVFDPMGDADKGALDPSTVHADFAGDDPRRIVVNKFGLILPRVFPRALRLRSETVNRSDVGISLLVLPRRLILDAALDEMNLFGERV